MRIRDPVLEIALKLKGTATHDELFHRAQALSECGLLQRCHHALDWDSGRLLHRIIRYRPHAELDRQLEEIAAWALNCNRGLVGFGWYCDRVEHPFVLEACFGTPSSSRKRSWRGALSECARPILRGQRFCLDSRFSGDFGKTYRAP